MGIPKDRELKLWSIDEKDRPLPKFLHISSNGDHYTILETGIYFIYAQVLYHDLSGRWAYGIFLDGDIAAQCTTSQTIAPDYISNLGPQSPSHGVYTHCYTAITTRIE